ncbi:MAG: hypothetical protein QM500_04470 [Methylococcales bacterium]
MDKSKQPLKKRFLDAVNCGELGTIDEYGVIVTVREFKNYFKDIKTDYIGSFLPAAAIEKGQTSVSHTKYLFHIRKGIYRVHPDVLLTVNRSSLPKDKVIMAKHSGFRI